MKIKLSRICEIIKEEILREIEFKDTEAFEKYKSTHKMRPTTKVSIAGKETTVGKASKSDSKKREYNLPKEDSKLYIEFDRADSDNPNPNIAHAGQQLKWAIKDGDKKDFEDALINIKKNRDVNVRKWYKMNIKYLMKLELGHDPLIKL